jgi:hypothetical protein
MHIARVLLRLFGAFWATRKGWCWRSCVDEGQRLPTVLILLSLIALTPLAHASPADPSWIPGIYDVGDHDDAIWVLTDPSTATSCAPTGVACAPIVTQGLLPAAVWISFPMSARSFHLRSPPAH